MENIEIKDVQEKEPVKKLSNTELNNNIVLDLIVKTSKLQQMLNVIMDYNNTATLDVVISADDFKDLQELLTNLFIKLKKVISEFADNYIIVRKENNDELRHEQNNSTDNSVQEPQDN